MEKNRKTNIAIIVLNIINTICLFKTANLKIEESLPIIFIFGLLIFFSGFSLIIKDEEFEKGNQNYLFFTLGITLLIFVSFSIPVFKILANDVLDKLLRS